MTSTPPTFCGAEGDIQSKKAGCRLTPGLVETAPRPTGVNSGDDRATAWARIVRDNRTCYSPSQNFVLAVALFALRIWMPYVSETRMAWKGFARFVKKARRIVPAVSRRAWLRVLASGHTSARPTAGPLQGRDRHRPFHGARQMRRLRPEPRIERQRLPMP